MAWRRGKPNYPSYKYYTTSGHKKLFRNRKERNIYIKIDGGFYQFLNFYIKLILQALGSPENPEFDKEHAYYALDEEKLKELLQKNLKIFNGLPKSVLEKVLEYMINQGDIRREKGKIFLIKNLQRW